MAAEASRAPIAVREQIVARSIEWDGPTINDLCGALEDTGCLAERLGALVSSNNADLAEFLEQLPESAVKNHLYVTWMIFTLAGEKLTEIQELLSAIIQKAYDERRAVAA